MDDRIRLACVFLDAKTDADYKALDSEYPRLFGYNALGQNVKDVKAVCDVARSAHELYALCHSDENPTTDDMLKCYVSPAFSGIGDANAPIDEIPISFFHVSYYRPVSGSNYCAWLSRTAEKSKERFPGFDSLSMEYSNGYLTYFGTDLHPIDKWDEAKADCEELLHQLINLHLADIATVCEDKTSYPVQMAYSGISLVWLGLVEYMSHGRAFRCEACDKPVIAYAERRAQKYCSDACRKWANANPGKKRGHWYLY